MCCVDAANESITGQDDETSKVDGQSAEKEGTDLTLSLQVDGPSLGGLGGDGRKAVT